MFRKGKALGEQGYFEKAEKILEQLKSENAAGCVLSCLMSVAHMWLQPLILDAPAADAELARLRTVDNEREKASRQKMKGKGMIGSVNTDRLIL